MGATFKTLADLLGASIDQIKLLSCLLVAYPLGSLFIRIPSTRPVFRHMFNVAVALLFFFPVLRMHNAFFQLLASVLGTYFIARLDHSSRMPWIVFVFVMGHLTANHVIRAFAKQSYETMEITGPQMVLTMKLTTFAWNVWDGRRPATELDKWQLEKRITQYPSILEFLGYAFYFPGILVGPYLDLSEYRCLISESLFPQTDSKSSRKLPSGRKRVAYFKMLMGLLYLGLYVVFGAKHNFAAILTPQFTERGYLSRIALFQIYGIFERCKYYAVWTLTEGASIVTGLGFTGFDSSGKSCWEGAANVVVTQIELAPNFKVLLDSWNMKTNVWLRECVYKRVTVPGKKPGNMSSMITFLTSAFWHGIASGYYLTFVLGGFITSAARLVRTNIRPLLLPEPNQPASLAKRLYDILGTILTVLLVNYAAAPFMLLDFRKSIFAWGLLGYYGHVIVFGGLLFFSAGGSSYFKRLREKKIVKTEKN